MIGNNYTSKANKFKEKVSRFVVTRDGGSGEGRINEGSQKAQTSSYEINKYYGRNVQPDKLTLLYMCKSQEGKSQEFSSQGEKFVSLIMYLYEITDVH